MRKIILASHGTFAQGAASALEMITGPKEGFKIYSLNQGEAATDFAAEIEKEINSSPQDEFIIVTDVYGASVSSAMYPLSAYENVKVFTGFNLIFLLSLFLDYQEPISDEDAEELLSTAKNGIRLLKYKKAVPTEQEDF